MPEKINKRNAREESKIDKKALVSFAREPYFVPSSPETQRIKRNLLIYSGATLLLQLNVLDFSNFKVFEVGINLSADQFLFLFLLLYLYSFFQYLFFLFDDVQHFRFNAKIIRYLRQSEGSIARARERIADYQQNPFYAYYLFRHTVERWQQEIRREKEKFRKLFNGELIEGKIPSMPYELTRMNDSLAALLSQFDSTEFDYGRVDTIQSFLKYLVFQNWKFSLFSVWVPLISLVPLFNSILCVF